MKSFKRAMQVGPKKKGRKEGTEERVACTSKVAGCGRIATYRGLGRAQGGGPWLKQEMKKNKAPGFREAFVLISSKPPSAKNRLPVSGFRFLGTVGALQDH